MRWHRWVAFRLFAPAIVLAVAAHVALALSLGVREIAVGALGAVALIAVAKLLWLAGSRHRRTRASKRDPA